MSRLTKIQNTAVRIITLCNPQDNITPHLKTLHWLPVPLRIKFKLLLTCYKIINNLALSYLNDLLIPLEIPHDLPSVEMGNFKVPKSQSVTYGDRAFTS